MLTTSTLERTIRNGYIHNYNRRRYYYTRCILWNSSRQRIDEQKREVGVRNTAIDGNNSKLKNAVKECLEQLLEDHSLTYE